MFQGITALGLLLTAFTSTALASPSLLARAKDNSGTCPGSYSPYPSPSSYYPPYPSSSSYYPPYPSSSGYYRARDLVAARAASASALNFSNSEWIYTNEVSSPGGNAPVGSRALRKTFVAPLGKTPVYATIIFSTDNEGALYVNGNEIVDNNLVAFGAGMYCVGLDSGPYATNVFAVNATNTAGPAAILFAAQITYTDGSTSDVVSDTTWRALPGNIPSGFQEPSFDDSAWPSATSQGLYPTGPWGTVDIAGVSTLGFDNANWIWTDELTNGTRRNAPPGARAFRKTFFLPSGHINASATAIITVDASFSLYVNGAFIGTGTNYRDTERYTIPNIQGPKVVFAVYAVNNGPTPNPAGVIAAFEVTSSDPTLPCVANCTSTTVVSTNAAGWKFNHTTPAGFQLPDFDDSTWPDAWVESRGDVLTVPTTDSAPGTPLSGAPGS